MTFKKTFALFCFCCFLHPMVFGQHTEGLADTLAPALRQLQMFHSLVADSVNNDLEVPNVFTPNGDDVNDYFEVTTDGTTVYELSIFTRTGTRIYHSLSTRIFWDGKSIEGKELPEGVYYYVIEQEGGSEPFSDAGFMHLFR